MNKPVKPKLKPSKRPKKRYILFKLNSGQNVRSQDAKHFMVSHLKNFFGSDFEQNGVWVTSFFEDTNMGIVRCNRQAVEEVKKGINSFRFKNRVLLVSGTIKTLKEKINSSKQTR